MAMTCWTANGICPEGCCATARPPNGDRTFSLFDDRRWLSMKYGMVLGAASLCAVACCALAGGAAAQTVQLKLADRLPQDHYVARYSTNYWIDEVQKATGGKLKITRYPSERLGKAKDMLSLAKAGITDIGEFVPGYIGDPLLLST